MLGCLVEKETTTPDLYPLSTNALVLACNQKSSRDPVVDYDDAAVTATMLALREQGLARTSRGEGSRVYKHAHTLGTALGLTGAELAALSVLMLRGPQTVGEIRTRSERQQLFDSLGQVEAVLASLAGREEPLVALLPRRPGQKEARWAHCLGPVEQGGPSTPAPPPAAGHTAVPELAALRRELDELRDRVERLERRAT